MRLTLLIPLFLVSRGNHVSALHNITVDDTDTAAIMYTPPGIWEPSALHLSSLDYGGGHSLGYDTAKATFSFTGALVMHH